MRAANPPRRDAGAPANTGESRASAGRPARRARGGETNGPELSYERSGARSDAPRPEGAHAFPRHREVPLPPPGRADTLDKPSSKSTARVHRTDIRFFLMHVRRPPRARPGLTPHEALFNFRLS